MRDAGVDVPLRDFGIERRFLHHASRGALLGELGLTAQDVARAVVETVAKFDSARDAAAGSQPRAQAAEQPPS
jgi:1-deoxy-D-xylulose-5-phosphate synthase